MSKSSYVFIADGIGITPFRSIIQDLREKHQHVQIVLLYVVRNEKEVLFQDVFNKAYEEIGLQTVYLEKLTPEIVQKYVPDLLTPHYYISGPQAKVATYSELLQDTGVTIENIKTDLFSGYE